MSTHALNIPLATLVSAAFLSLRDRSALEKLVRLVVRGAREIVAEHTLLKYTLRSLTEDTMLPATLDAQRKHAWGGIGGYTTNRSRRAGARAARHADALPHRGRRLELLPRGAGDINAPDSAERTRRSSPPRRRRRSPRRQPRPARRVAPVVLLRPTDGHGLRDYLGAC